MLFDYLQWHRPAAPRRRPFPSPAPPTNTNLSMVTPVNKTQSRTAHYLITHSVTTWPVTRPVTTWPVTRPVTTWPVSQSVTTWPVSQPVTTWPVSQPVTTWQNDGRCAEYHATIRVRVTSPPKSAWPGVSTTLNRAPTVCIEVT